MMVYLVTNGHGSDTVIIGVFTHEWTAQELTNHLPNGELLPMELDHYAWQIQYGQRPYHVELTADGHMISCHPTNPVRCSDDTHVWATSRKEAVRQVQANQLKTRDITDLP